MEPPLPLAAPPLAAAAAAAGASAAHLNSPGSVDSSPRSRNADSWDEPPMTAVPGGGAKLRLMCSYGGHIVPRPHDKTLCYVGGDTRIVVADRQSTLPDLTNRLSKTLLNGQLFSLKYQLPNEDLDSLISVTTDEDLENMIEEYDRLTAANSAQKSSRLRLFLFPLKPDSASSIGSLLEDSTKSEDWFVNALNGATGGFSESASVNCLLGLDEDVAIAGNENASAKDVEAQLESFGNVKGVGRNSNKHGAQDVHSVPDSPMLETASSFGSTSSSPSLANLPPIRVHVEDQKAAVSRGIEEQFAQMGVSAVMQKQADGGFVVLSSPPTGLTPVAAASGFPTEYSNRVFSDDERSEQGLPVGYRKPPQSQQQPQPLQSQSKPIDLVSPDSVSSDSSMTNPLSRQSPLIYQDQVVQNPSGNNRLPVSPIDPNLSDTNSRVQIQQVQDSGYVLPNKFDQQQRQLNHQQQQLNHQQQQFNQQQQQQLNQQQEQLSQQQQLNQQHQQFLQAGTHYIHPHPTGPVPMTSYYPIYPPQQRNFHPHHPLDQQYSMFYMPSRQAQAYNLPVQQQNYGEATTNVPSSQPQTSPSPAMMPPPSAYTTARNVSAPKPEMAAGMYRTATSATPPLVQAPFNQHQQYVGFSQVHHPSQSGAHASAVPDNYAYEFVDPYAQIYYNQHLAPQLAAQYQTMTSAPAMVSTEASTQLPTDNIKH